MAVDFEQLMMQMEAAYPGVSIESVDGQYDTDKAWEQWDLGDDHWCLYRTLSAVTHIDSAGEDIVGYFLWGANGFDSMIPLAFRYLKGEIDAIEPTIDMSMIINAMLEADPDQVKWFVGIVDAFRQSIWNQPFDAEFFAALGRGFMLWP